LGPYSALGPIRRSVIRRSVIRRSVIRRSVIRRSVIRRPVFRRSVIQRPVFRCSVGESNKVWKKKKKRNCPYSETGVPGQQTNLPARPYMVWLGGGGGKGVNGKFYFLQFRLDKDSLKIPRRWPLAWFMLKSLSIKFVTHVNGIIIRGQKFLFFLTAGC
jgi:hypothetical protein